VIAVWFVAYFLLWMVKVPVSTVNSGLKCVDVALSKKLNEVLGE